MIELLLFSLNILFHAIVVLLLVRNRKIFGLVPLYMFLVGCLIFGQITTSLSLFTFLGFDVASTAITIYPLMLFSLILIYEIRGIDETKKFIFGIILAVLMIIPLSGFHLLNSKYILSPISPYDFEWQKAVFVPNISISSFSILGFIASVFVLIVVYNFAKGLFNNKFLSVFISLTLALYVDSLIFVSGLYLGGLDSPNILSAHIISKTFASLLYSVIYMIGFPLVIKKEEKILPHDIIELDETIAEFGGKVEGALKILVVEDSPESMELLTFSLKYEDNWEVVSAKNGKEALGMVFAENPDIILLDIMMPEMDGYEVVKILKAHKSTGDIPIILITAKVEREDKLRGMAIGIDDYITKPYVPEEVIARIRMVLKRDRQ